MEWTEFFAQGNDSRQAALVLPRNSYFCTQKKFALAIGRDIEKAVNTAAKDISPYIGGIVCYWISKSESEFVVTFWCFKKEISDLIREADAYIIVPESFEKDIAQGPTDLSEDAIEFSNQSFLRMIMKSPHRIVGLVNQNAWGRLWAPFNRYYFAKMMAAFLAITFGYLLTVSIYIWAVGVYVDSKKEAVQPKIIEYFNLKNQVDNNTSLLSEQNQLISQYNGHALIIETLQNSQASYELVISSFRFNKDKFRVTLEANNANDLIEELMKNKKFQNLRLSGAVNKSKGKDKFTIEFNWSNALWR